MSEARRPTPLPMVWSSMLLSIGTIGGFATFLAGDVIDPQRGIALTLAGSAFLPAMASLLVGRLVLRGLPAQTVWILRWALAEAVAIVGLMVRLLGGPPLVAGALVVLSLGLVLSQYPRSE